MLNSFPNICFTECPKTFFLQGVQNKYFGRGCPEIVLKTNFRKSFGTISGTLRTNLFSDIPVTLHYKTICAPDHTLSETKQVQKKYFPRFIAKNLFVGLRGLFFVEAKVCIISCCLQHAIKLIFALLQLHNKVILIQKIQLFKYNSMKQYKMQKFSQNVQLHATVFRNFPYLLVFTSGQKPDIIITQS